MRRLSAALFAARAAAVYVQEAVLQGQCRPLPKSSSSPVLCLLCFALPALLRRGPMTVSSRACFTPEQRCSSPAQALLCTTVLFGGSCRIA